MNLIVSCAIGWLAGSFLFTGIMLEVYKVASWQSRVSLLCAVIITAHSVAQIFSH
jgi:hypothetical protein